jgi:predicted dehydrogenase
MKVGLIGCGRIAFEAHLPAYKKYGVKIVAVCDLIKEKAQQAAKQYNIPFHCTEASDLAAHPEVQLLDIATPPQNRIILLRKLYKFGKPMLIQKPLSYDFDEAKLICEEFEKNNLIGAVNHNARWAPVSLKITEWIRGNKLGKIYQIHHVNRFNENIKSWYTDIQDYLFLDHGLHYFDLVRHFSQQTPAYVSANEVRKPNQIAGCSLAYAINLRFKDKMLASLYFNNAAPAPHSFTCRWFIDGDLASAQGTIDSVACFSTDKVLFPEKRLSGDWVPEGFLGSYEALVKAIKTNTIPPHSLRDHLISFKVATAAALSAKKNGAWVKIK